MTRPALFLVTALTLTILVFSGVSKAEIIGTNQSPASSSAEFQGAAGSHTVVTGEWEPAPDVPWTSTIPDQGAISAAAPVWPANPLESNPLVPNYLMRNPGDTLFWDDGQQWLTSYYGSGGNGWGVEFEPYYYPCRITSFMIWFRDGWPVPGGDDLILLIVDDDGPDGMPGTTIYADTLWDVAEMGVWNDFAVGDTGVVIDDGIFYGFYIQIEDPPYCPAAAFDQGYDINHGWRFFNGEYAQNTSWADMLLRARVERAGGDAHDVGIRSLLSPGNNYEPGVPIEPQAVVKNWGTFEESFDVRCIMDTEGEVVYDEIVSVTALAPDVTELVVFPQYTAEEGNVFNLEFRTLLYPDDTPMNDTRTSRTWNYTVERSTVLLEGSTGTWCSPCQYAAQGLDSLRVVAGDTVAIIEYHYSDPFATDDSKARIDYYYISSYPTIVFDGIDRVVGAGPFSFNSYRIKKNNELGRNVPVEMTVEGAYDEQTRGGYVQVGVNAVDGIAADDLRLHTVLTESHIPYVWFDEDSLQFVMREMFPDVSGIPIQLSKGHFVQELLFFEVSEDYIDEHCELIVFLQDNDSKEVIGAYTTHLSDMATTSEVFVSAVPDTTHYHRGETLGYTLTLVNNTDSTITTESWTEVETPWGAHISPVSGPDEVSLSAYQTSVFNLTQYIPTNSPYGGAYTFIVKLGTYPDDVLAEDGFTFYVDPPDIAVELVPDASYVQRGDPLGFQATVTNNEDSTVHFDAWTEAELPNGFVISPLIGPVNVTLNAGQAVSPHMNELIPGNAPYGGPYIYRLKVGLFPNPVYNEDSFDFFVVPGR